MDEVEVVVAMVGALNATQIPYMVVGSLSSNAYGIPRSTEDADFVVQLGSVPISKLLHFLPEGFRLESQIGVETITSTTRYRIQYENLGIPFGIELFELSDDPHDKMRFERRVPTTYGGSPAYMPRAEDVVVMKLRWFKVDNRRAKDLADVRDVLAVQSGKLDMEYLQKWCDIHGTRDLLEETLAELPIIPPPSAI